MLIKMADMCVSGTHMFNPENLVAHLCNCFDVSYMKNIAN